LFPLPQKSITFVLCSLLAMGGLATSASRGLAQQSAGYKITDFLGSTFISQVEVSPGGHWVAFITNHDDFTTDRTDTAVWVLDLSTGADQKPPLRLTAEGVAYSRLRWSPGERTLAAWSGGEADGVANLVLFDSLHAWHATVLTSPTAPGGIVTYDWNPDGSGLAFVSTLPLDSAGGASTLDNEFHPADSVLSRRWQLYRASVNDGRVEASHLLSSLSQAPREIAYSPDGRKLALLMTNVMVMPSDGSAEPHAIIAPMPWQRIDGNLRWTPQGIFARGYGELDGGVSRRTQRRLFQILPESAKLNVVASQFRGEWLDYTPVADSSVVGIGLNGLDSRIYSIANGGASPTIVSLENAGAGPMSASRNGAIIAYAASNAMHFTELYIARAGKFDHPVCVTALNKSLNEQPSPEAEVVRWSNGDGDHIEGVLYWPPGKRGTKGLPTIIVLHGGPQQGVTVSLAASSAPFANYPALLASRGYLVLYPAFRGTTGFGEDFMRAIDEGRCSRASKDVITGVDYLVSKGWADAARLGIMGTSFGGTTTNCVIGRTTRFRVAVSSEGSFDGISANGQHASEALELARDPATGRTPYNDHEYFWNESAIGNAIKIRTPTLIDRGGKDVVVNPSQSEELATALATNGVPYRLLLFPSEGHMFARPADKRLKLEAEIAWIDHYLLGLPLP
jgi:dipeptidyl aminopeptidase/acylaminoacyl peptidase